MEDRCLFFDSKTYGDYSIEKREILKANSPGSSRSSHGSRTSFFFNPFSFTTKNIKDPQQVSFLVAESAEIPIFRNPKRLNWQEDGSNEVVSLPLFSNST